MSNALTLPDAKAIFKEILENPEKMFDMLRIDMRRCCERAISEILKVELTGHIGREKYERVSVSSKESGSSGTSGTSVSESGNEVEVNYRNGSYMRKFAVKGIGELDIEVPRDRLGTFNSQLIDKYRRREKSLDTDIVMMFLSGLSTRGLSLISHRLLGKSISASEVSNVSKEMLTGIDAWRLRPLSDLKIKYMFMDGVNFDVRVEDSIEKVPMLIVIGVTETNQRVFLCIQQGDKESSSTWREIFKDMKNRGLDYARIRLGVMDGLTGLEKVFKEEFPNGKIQRCQVHVARNVLTKVPHKMKMKVADRIRDIFYASSKGKAREFYDKFVKDYEKSIPSAVGSLKNSIDRCLTFYDFPVNEWKSLKTTNMVERINKEFRRRTKPMEIMAGESSAYRILCFVALKMELKWRSTPFGKTVPPQKAIEEFTQNT
jgi:putative transposase